MQPILLVLSCCSSFLLGQRKLTNRFSSPPAPKKNDKINKIEVEKFSEATGLMLKTDFKLLFKIANHIFVMKSVLKQGFLLFPYDS